MTNSICVLGINDCPDLQLKLKEQREKIEKYFNIKIPEHLK